MSDNEPKPCDFCGRRPPQVKLTGEHVLRNWLRKSMPEIESRGVWQRWLDEDGVVHEETLEIPESPFDQTSRRVCDGCNSGWMNDLEVAVEATLLRMIQGGDVRLAPAEVVPLAGWAAKTAAVRSRADKGTQVVTAADCRKIMRTRRPPLAWQVWIAQASDPHVVFVPHARRGWMGMSLHLTIIVIGRLLLLVVGCDGNQKLGKAMQASWRSIMLASDDPLVALWPPTGEGLRWPTGLVHGPDEAAELYALLDRFMQAGSE